MNKIILLIGLIAICSCARGQTKNVETISKVDTLVTPDRIYLSILISESYTKGKQ